MQNVLHDLAVVRVRVSVGIRFWLRFMSEICKVHSAFCKLPR